MKQYSFLMESISGNSCWNFVIKKYKKDFNIDFPKEEIPVLSKQKKFVTTRVSDDYKKYWHGDIVMTPWGKRYKIVKRLNITDIKDHPYYKELTKDQIKFLNKFNEICVLWGEQI